MKQTLTLLLVIAQLWSASAMIRWPEARPHQYYYDQYSDTIQPAHVGPNELYPIAVGDHALRSFEKPPPPLPVKMEDPSIPNPFMVMLQKPMHLFDNRVNTGNEIMEPARWEHKPEPTKPDDTNSKPESPDRRPEFADENNKLFVRGMRGEINIKWSVRPILERMGQVSYHHHNRHHRHHRHHGHHHHHHHHHHFDRIMMVAPFDAKQREVVPVSNFLPQQFQTFRAAINQEDNIQNISTNDDQKNIKGIFEESIRRERRQIGNWNFRPFFRQLMGGNSSNVLDNFGRQMSRQFHTSDQTLSGVLQSVQKNFKRLVNVNMSQLFPRKLLA